MRAVTRLLYVKRSTSLVQVVFAVTRSLHLHSLSKTTYEPPPVMAIANSREVASSISSTATLGMKSAVKYTRKKSGTPASPYSHALKVASVVKTFEKAKTK